MADRWNPKRVTRPVERPLKVFVPGPVDPRCDATPTSDLNSQHRVTEHPAGFRVRERGALDGTVVHAYRCPVHGLVDVRVPRGAVPDEIACGVLIIDREHPVTILGRQVAEFECAEIATWAGSQCGQGHAAGEVMS